MELKEKILFISLLFEGKIYSFTVNSKKTFKFLLIKISSEIELEDIENFRERYILSYKNKNINDINDYELLEILFTKEIKNSIRNVVEIRVKLDNKSLLKPEQAFRAPEDELKIFKLDLKEKLEILENESSSFKNKMIEKLFQTKIQKNCELFMDIINRKKSHALESKTYSYKLIDKMKTLLENNEFLEKEYKCDNKILQKYKNEMRKYSYLDSSMYIAFIDKVEEKIRDLLNFVQSKFFHCKIF